MVDANRTDVRLGPVERLLAGVLAAIVICLVILAPGGDVLFDPIPSRPVALTMGALLFAAGPLLASRQASRALSPLIFVMAGGMLLSIWTGFPVERRGLGMSDRWVASGAAIAMACLSITGLLIDRLTKRSHLM